MRFHSLSLALGVAVAAVAGCTRSSLDLGGPTPTPTASTSPSGTPSATPTPAQDFGNGSTGPATIGANATLNTCHSLVNGIGTSMDLDATRGFAPGGRLFVVQMQDDVAISGSTSPYSNFGTAGRWELARIASANATSVTLDAPLSSIYRTIGTRTAQACTIPEFTTVTIPSGVTVRASPWDGATGGILALMANGSLQLDGTLNATGDGFRGGAVGNGASCTPLSNPPLDTTLTKAGGKGEGLDGRSFTRAGRGDYANGAGGAGTCQAGGAGGGNGGEGGVGGKSSGSGATTTEGMGGASLAVTGQYFLGGGGGGGHGMNGLAGAGGAGGGLVLVFASSIAGSGSILANGANGKSDSPTIGDGAGGGGAGGTIVVVTAGSGAFSGTASAHGGNGGDALASSNQNLGPGGGGGGGRVSGVANPDVSGGTPGITGIGLPGMSNGATAGAAGVALP